MKIIVGLGNPGEKYQHNRHNIGFRVLEALKTKMTNDQFPISNVFTYNKKFNAEIIQTDEFILVKPQTFMNDSGVAVSAICRFYKVKYQDLYVIHDDLDLKIGNFKIQFGKAPRGHNGLGSVDEKLGTNQYWRVRIGVENREVRGNKGIPGVEYSLQNFAPAERAVVDQVIAKVVDELTSVLS